MIEVEKWLHSRIGLNFRSGLGRMQRAVDLLGNPEQTYPIIHVTGTNGKGSTIAFMRELFVAHGKTVGTFTSPHIVSIHDRICINGEPISDEDFIRLADQVKAMGGLLDTTNVVTGEIAIITSIGLDHQETLGDSLTAIAEQKAGIFKPGNSAVIANLAPESQLVCQRTANDLGVTLYQANKDFSFKNGRFSSSLADLHPLKLGLEGAYQEENAALALQAFLLFMNQRGEKIDEKLVQKALKHTRWAGRLEAITSHTYLDGAHNLPALERLVEFIQEKIQQGYKAQILFGALKRKDYGGMLAYLTEHLPDATLYVTSFDYQGSLEEQDLGGYTIIASYRDFIDNFEASAEERDLLFVTGSLYFISEVRAYLMNPKSFD